MNSHRFAQVSEQTFPIAPSRIGQIQKTHICFHIDQRRHTHNLDTRRRYISLHHIGERILVLTFCFVLNTTIWRCVTWFWFICVIWMLRRLSFKWKVQDEMRLGQEAWQWWVSPDASWLHWPHVRQPRLRGSFKKGQISRTNWQIWNSQEWDSHRSRFADIFMVFPDSHWGKCCAPPTQFGAASGNKNLPNYAKAKKRMTGLEFLPTLECKGNTNRRHAHFLNVWMWYFYIIQW